MYVLFGILAFFALAAAALVIGAVRERRRLERRRTSVTVDRMAGYVKGLLLSRAPGSTLVFDANDGDGFLQLALTGREGDWRRVEFGLPDAEWSHENFALAVLTLGGDAAECLVEEDPRNVQVPRFLSVLLEGDSEDVAARAATLLGTAAQTLGFSAAQTFTVSMSGRDHPDFLRTSADEIERRGLLPRWFTRRIVAFMRAQADEVERELDAPASARTRLPHARRRVPAKRRPRDS
ncbi:MAG: hypothetical protein ACJ8J0_03515 [Longimicrobiaceae bacterium]